MEVKNEEGIISGLIAEKKGESIMGLSRGEPSLENLINELVTELIKERKLDGTNKEKIVGEMVENIKNWELSKEDLADRKVQDILCIAIINKAVAQKFPEYGLEVNFDFLFKKNPDFNNKDDVMAVKDELEKNLRKTFEVVFKLNPENMTPQKKEQLDQYCKELTEKLIENFKNSPEDRKRLVDTPPMAAVMSAAELGLLNLFGVNPRFTGGVAIVVLQNQGNGRGFADLNGPSPEAKDFISESNSIENEIGDTVARLEALGVLPPAQDFEQAKAREAKQAQTVGDIFEAIGNVVSASLEQENKSLFSIPDPSKIPTPRE